MPYLFLLVGLVAVLQSFDLLLQFFPFQIYNLRALTYGDDLLHKVLRI